MKRFSIGSCQPFDDSRLSRVFCGSWDETCLRGSCSVALVLLSLAVGPTLPRFEKLANRIGRSPAARRETISTPAWSQINRSNVKRLQVAWQFDTGDSAGWLEHSPLVIDGVLYACTPGLKIFALHAATGKQMWKFDSGVRATQPNRGLSFLDGRQRKTTVRRHHEFPVRTGCKDGKAGGEFRSSGRVNLEENFWRPAQGQYVLTSPGAIYKDLIIVGGRSSETLPAPPGDIRAYDVRTGKIRWSFHTVPHPGEFGYETWPKEAWKYIGGANNWAGVALDVERGISIFPPPPGSPGSTAGCEWVTTCSAPA